MLRPHVQMGGGGARSSAGLRAVSSAQGGICTAERRYLEDGMAMGHRIDGRSCLQYRPSTVEYGILPSANGSARMWTRDNNDVLVSVKCEVGPPPDPHDTSSGAVRVSVQCCASVGLEFGGRGGEEACQFLSCLIDEFCTNDRIIGRKQLCILAGHFCWTVYVDVTVLNAGGSIIDTISCAVRAALRDTILPKTSAILGIEEETGEEDRCKPKLSCDSKEAAGSRLPGVDKVPVLLTVAQISGRFAWDVTEQEEACATSVATLAVDARGRCVGIHCGGPEGLELASLPTVLQNSQHAGAETIRQLEKAEEQQLRRRHQRLRPLGFLASPGDQL
eukprot:GHVT01087543.1.p1 GENE.GHVT01087543.1~~GHVT01087543.1.p1  ORF type:complete len:333 (-),score=43.36 GHVT01087543.1:418-1416(-)